MALLGGNLHSLARLYGIQTSYVDVENERRRATPDTLAHALRALGADLDAGPGAAARTRREEMDARVLDHVYVAWDGTLRMPTIRLAPGGARAVDVELETEDGETRRWRVTPRGRSLRIRVADRLPLGYHTLRLAHGRRRYQAHIISAPRRAYDAPWHAWGVFAPTYALHSRDSCVGGYTELHELARAVHAAGGDVVATLPMLATFLDAPFEPSPYAPASRLFWSDLFVDAAHFGAEIDETLARELADCRATELIDYRRAGQLQRRLLQPLADRMLAVDATPPDSLRVLLRNRDVQEFARFRAIGEQQGRGWPAWPKRLQERRLRSSDGDPAAVRYHLFTQWAAQQQLNALAHDAGAADLYLDMPLGVHPDSFDVWRQPELFLTGMSAGAPPDALFRGGQDWGFPPPHPDAMRRDGYTYFAACLRHQMRFARVLRMDHVMALYRLYVVPHGAAATDGVYLRYPADELFAVLALESLRNRCIVIGEDLGTVPSTVRARMRKHGVRRLYVAQYEMNAEREPVLSEPAAGTIASLNTHDMPPFSAFWHGDDVADQRDLGLLDDEGADHAHAARVQLRRALVRDLRLDRRSAAAETPGPALDALLERLADSDAGLVLLNLEDLWLERRPQNVPGTNDPVRPNWRRRAARPTGAFGEAEVNARVRRVAQRRAAARKDGEHA